MTIELCLIGGLLSVILTGIICSVVEKKMELTLRRDSEIRKWRERARRAESDRDTLMHRIPAAESHLVRLRDEENEALREEIAQLEQKFAAARDAWAAKYEALELVAGRLWPPQNIPQEAAPPSDRTYNPKKEDTP